LDSLAAHGAARRPVLRPAKLSDFFSDPIGDHLANHPYEDDPEVPLQLIQKKLAQVFAKV